MQGDVRELRGRVSAIKFILEKEQAQNYELISRANLLDKKLEKKDRIIEEKSRIITEQSEEIKKLNKNISNKLD